MHRHRRVAGPQQRYRGNMQPVAANRPAALPMAATVHTAIMANAGAPTAAHHMTGQANHYPLNTFITAATVAQPAAAQRAAPYATQAAVLGAPAGQRMPQAGRYAEPGMQQRYPNGQGAQMGRNPGGHYRRVPVRRR